MRQAPKATFQDCREFLSVHRFERRITLRAPSMISANIQTIQPEQFFFCDRKKSSKNNEKPHTKKGDHTCMLQQVCT